jgi:tetratricopeptide (TPR) repeat protein
MSNKAISNSGPDRGDVAAANRRRLWVSTAILVAVILTAFWRVTGQDFVHWDDKGHTFGNPYLQHIDKANLLHFWQEPYEHLYIPLSYMVFALLCVLAQMPHHDPSVTSVSTLLNPHVFHVANLILHVGNALLVFALLRCLTSRVVPSVKSPYPALFGALIFAVHPLQVESVAWISELRGQLSSIFCLGTLYTYVSAIQLSDKAPWKLGRYWIGLLLTILGLLCKPSVITVGLLLVVLDRWIYGRPWRMAIMTASPWLVLAVPFVLLTQHAQPVSVAGGTGALWQRPFIAADALAFYLTKFFLPVNLGIEYGRSPAYVLQHTWIYFTWLAPAMIALAIFVFRKRSPWLVAGGLLSLGVLLPVLGLVPYAYQNYSTVADRYVYLGLIGPGLIGAVALAKAIERDLAKPVYPAAAIGIIVLVGLTLGQVRYWDNSATLFAHAIKINPGSYGVRTNYGISLADLGRTGEAIGQYQAAIKLAPELPDAWQNMGISLQQEGRNDEAMACFQRVIQSNPNDELGHAAMGFTWLAEGNPDEALPELEIAARLNPSDAENLAHFAATLQQLGRMEEATVQYRQALSIDPANIAALTGLASLDSNAGRLDAAETECRHAVEISPKDPRTHAALGDILQKEGEINDAIAQYRQAIQFDPHIDALHFTLGSALFKSGDHAGAIPELQEAARLGPTPYHHDELGVAYATIGNMTAAKQEFEAALNLDPHFSPALQHIAMLESSK